MQGRKAWTGVVSNDLRGGFAGPPANSCGILCTFCQFHLKDTFLLPQPSIEETVSCIYFKLFQSTLQAATLHQTDGHMNQCQSSTLGLVSDLWIHFEKLDENALLYYIKDLVMMGVVRKQRFPKLISGRTWEICDRYQMWIVGSKCDRHYNFLLFYGKMGYQGLTTIEIKASTKAVKIP